MLNYQKSKWDSTVLVKQKTLDGLSNKMQNAKKINTKITLRIQQLISNSVLPCDYDYYI